MHNSVPSKVNSTKLNQIGGSSVSSPICQEGQSERNFPDFCFFFPVFSLFSWIFPDFSWFFPDFSRFWHFFCCQGWHSAPLATPVATPLLEGSCLFVCLFIVCLSRLVHVHEQLMDRSRLIQKYKSGSWTKIISLSWKLPKLLRKGIFLLIFKKKKIVEPIFQSTAPILQNNTAIEGTLMHSISAL